MSAIFGEYVRNSYVQNYSCNSSFIGEPVISQDINYFLLSFSELFVFSDLWVIRMHF